MSQMYPNQGQPNMYGGNMGFNSYQNGYMPQQPMPQPNNFQMPNMPNLEQYNRELEALKQKQNQYFQQMSQPQQNQYINAQQPMQAEIMQGQQPTQQINSAVVNSKEEADNYPISLTGSMFILYDIVTSKIYSKQFDVKSGNVSFKVYEESQQNVSPAIDEKEETIESEIKSEEISGIREDIRNLQTEIYQLKGAITNVQRNAANVDADESASKANNEPNTGNAKSGAATKRNNSKHAEPESNNGK